MAIVYNFEITDRVKTSTQTLSDGQVVENYIDAVVVILSAHDEDTDLRASTDPWVSLAYPSDLDPATYVPWDDITAMPDHIKTQLEAWGNDAERRQQLADQIESQKVAPVEKLSPWAA